MVFLVLPILLIYYLPANGLSDLEITRKCEPIRITTCSNIGYNVTGMPNFAGNDIQRDADLQIQTFTPLIQYGCSSRLRFFLCSVYVPMCTEKVPQPIGPCQTLCESVKGLCEPVLLEFGFKWPATLNCSRFPSANNEKHMCMEGPEHEERHHVPFRETRLLRSGIKRGSGSSTVSRPRYYYNPVSTTKTFSRSMCKHFRLSKFYYYVNNTQRCAAACHSDILYSKENKQFAEVWIAVWSILCFLSTFYTICVFFSKTEYFCYPQKIIIILSSCYFMQSIALFIRLIGGREEMACYWDHYYMEPLLIQGGLDNINCTVVFSLLYFFGMANYIWWVILTLYWFLTSVLRWNSEALERISTYWHLLAWFLPAMKTIYILVMRNVDADELTGICYVGNQDPQVMLRFVLLPSIAYLSIGVFFLTAGFIIMIKRKILRIQIANRRAKWEILNRRLGIFSALYTIPTLCVISANIYEFLAKDEWLAVNATTRPNVEIFTLKLFMSLVVGITTGIWLYTSKISNFDNIKFNISKICPQNQVSPIYNPQNNILLLNNTQRKMTIV